MKLHDKGAYILNQTEIVLNDEKALHKIEQKTGQKTTKEKAKKATISYGVIEKHNTSKQNDFLNIQFDILGGHDVNAVSILQSARASGLEKFSKPYVLTNCHNALCAVGGTINEDDHKYLLSVIKKYGGVFVPPSLAIIHQYMREMWAAPGKMILSSDSHTRYGPLGTLATGEGGGEIVKQLLGKTYDIERPEIVGIYLKGKLQDGVGPHDVALALIGEVFKKGFVKDAVLEFIGTGLSSLSMDYRFGIDTMTTETTCWASIWQTDDQVKSYLDLHGREDDYELLRPEEIAYYDKLVIIDLSEIRPMIAFPFHPSNVFSIEAVQNNPREILGKIQHDGQLLFKQQDVTFDLLNKIKDGAFYVDQAIIGSCAGGLYENISDAADILADKGIGEGEFNMSVYPASQPIYLELLKIGAVQKLIKAGAIIKPAICGPCFGAGDIPGNGEISVRNTTRNFSNREGSIANQGQLSSVALMDARSIAATAANKGRLTAATEMQLDYTKPKYYFDKEVYKNRVYNGVGKPQPETQIKYGPNIKDWPEFHALNDMLLIKLISVFEEDVITTDDLLPSDASNFRSNPERLAEHTLVMKDPSYVSSAKNVRTVEERRRKGDLDHEIAKVMGKISQQIEGLEKIDANHISVGSAIYAKKLGDGSSREQSASNQKVLGAWANIAKEYATKRYASNVKNWGMIPLVAEDERDFEVGDFILLPYIKDEILEQKVIMTAYLIREEVQQIELKLLPSTEEEREIMVSGGLLNYYKKDSKK